MAGKQANSYSKAYRYKDNSFINQSLVAFSIYICILSYATLTFVILVLSFSLFDEIIQSFCITPQPKLANYGEKVGGIHNSFTLSSPPPRQMPS